MRNIIATTAIALVTVATIGSASDAHALLDDNSTKATAVAGAAAGAVAIGKGGGGGGGGGGGDATINNETKKLHNNAPSLGMGSVSANGGFYNGAVRNACVGSRGQGWMAGLTGGVDNGVVTGGGLGFGRSTTEETIAVQCEIGEQATEMMKVGLVDAAQRMQCLSVFKRKVLDVMDPTYCAGQPVVGASFARFEDTQLINTVSAVPVEQSKRSAAFVPQPVVATKPAGNATNGKCTYGFNYTTGQCASPYANLTDG